MPIWKINDKKQEKLLRQTMKSFDFKGFTKKEISELITRMRKEMHAADGIGLSANQIGLNFQCFVAEIPEIKNDKLVGSKFYAVFNPKIVKASKKTNELEEGCLSVPDMIGLVERPEKITLVGQDKNGKKIKIKAWGLLARVFQHETDHLNGKLFIDTAKGVQNVKKQNK